MDRLAVQLDVTGAERKYLIDLMMNNWRCRPATIQQAAPGPMPQTVPVKSVWSAYFQNPIPRANGDRF
jgi:hypothetical protein